MARTKYTVKLNFKFLSNGKAVLNGTFTNVSTGNVDKEIPETEVTASNIARLKVSATTGNTVQRIHKFVVTKTGISPTVSYTAGNLNISIDNATAGSYASEIYIGEFDGEGNLVNVEVAGEKSINSNAVLDISNIDFTKTEESNTAKVFIWEKDSQKPITIPAEF